MQTRDLALTQGAVSISLHLILLCLILSPASSAACWRKAASELCLVADHYCFGRRPNSTEDAAWI